MSYQYYDFTLSLCPTCLRRVDAKITIEAGSASGPEYVDFEAAVQMRRKRETEEELVEFVRRKKRRTGSMNLTTQTLYDNMLPGPTDLAELDDASTSSLLLDDLDFPSLHTDEALVKPVTAVKEDQVTNLSSEEDAMDISGTTKMSEEEDSKKPAMTDMAMMPVYMVMMMPMIISNHGCK